MDMAKRKSKSKMGRPPIPPAERRVVRVTVHMQQRELRLLTEQAKRRGVSLSELLMQPWRGEKKE